MSLNQKQWTINRLNQDGKVSRNEALKNYITRLGAIIHQLNKEGWEIEGRWQTTPYSRDFVYYKKNRRFQSASEINQFIRSLEG